MCNQTSQSTCIQRCEARQARCAERPCYLGIFLRRVFTRSSTTASGRSAQEVRAQKQRERRTRRVNFEEEGEGVQFGEQRNGVVRNTEVRVNEKIGGEVEVERNVMEIQVDTIGISEPPSYRSVMKN